MIADRPADVPSELDGSELARVLERLAAETRADDAAASRRRTSWLGRQAQEEATMVGVLLDLADRERPVVVHAASGRSHRGWIEAVGTDFVAVRTVAGIDALVRLDALAAVRSIRNDIDTVGQRPLVVDATLATTVRSLGPVRPRLLVISGARAEPIVGELRWAGRDVAALRLDGDGATAYVPLVAVSEVCGADRLLD